MKTDRHCWVSFLTVPLFFLCLFLVSAALFGCSDKLSEEKEPVPQTRDLTVGIGAKLPSAEDFFDELPTGCSVSLLTDYRSLTDAGEHEIGICVTLASGTTCEVSAKLTLVRDTVPPILLGVADLSVQIGDAIAYRKGIVVTDDCFGEVTLMVDSSLVDPTREGTYPVIYTATDAVGNTASQTAYVHVYAHLFSEDELWELVDAVVAERGWRGKSTVEQCRRIYEYVQGNVSYSGTSDKSDWKKEAYHALVKGSGDCFTYFALAKAFFVRLGIEHLDVQRSPDVAQRVNERHYWLMVNIEKDGGTPRWYHFDACRLIAEYSHSGCLLTDKQIDAYNRLRHNADGVNNYFYAYDRASYPATDEKIITPTPNLEPYD